ncbi:MAG: Crp/Fnr family transcriptional regulator [Gemmatimonadota bacterium]|nr:Crp/Fnr family transcriptional regulator [Gemmatimonadota bacterium]
MDNSLRTIPLFSLLRESDIWRIREATVSRSFPKDSVILFEGEPGEALYIVLSGRVKIVYTAEDGREVILSTREKGDFFGETALLDEQPNPAHVIAMQDSELLILRRDEFRRCLTDMPEVSLGLLRHLSRRLRHADDQIRGLVLLDVRGRVARLLLDMADRADGTNVPKGITHNIMAQMVGASRETVSRTLRELTISGLLAVTGRRIAVADRAGLQAAAQLDPVAKLEPVPPVPVSTHPARRASDLARSS